MTGNMYAKEGFEVKQFDQFRYVFTGHFHLKSKNKNVHYLGTQYPITWNDFGETKGFHVLEDDFKLKYYENNYTPKFVKIFYNENANNQLIEVAGLSGS